MRLLSISAPGATPYAPPAARVPTPASWTFRYDIEGLRAVAILFVVLYHTGSRFAAGGFLGVDVFFVLSGFLISGILLDEIDRTGTVSLTGFWARRARRLLPAATLVSVVTIVFGAVLASPHARIVNARSAEWFSVYASNIRFASRASDYFAMRVADDPLLHTWSLSIEEQFYLLFAPLMLLLAWLSRRLAPAALRARFVVVALTLTVISFAVCVVTVYRVPTWSFYLLPARAWEFGIGALAVALAPRIPANYARATELAGLACLVALLASAVLIDARFVHPSAISLVPVIATAGLLTAGTVKPDCIVSRGLSVGPMRIIGRLSYSWYLWHWPLLVFLLGQVPHASASLRLLVAALSLLPAVLAFHVLESPIRHSRFLRGFPRATLVGALALAAFAMAVARVAIRPAAAALRREPYATIERARNERPAHYESQCQHARPLRLPAECVYGPANAGTSVVLFGDSHAAQWFPAIRLFAAEHGWRLVPLTTPRCLPMRIRVPGRVDSPFAEPCDRWRVEALQAIRNAQPAVVILGYFRNVRRGLFQTAEVANVPAALLGKDLAGLAQQLTKGGARVIVLANTPYPEFDVPDCLEAAIAPERCSLPRATSAPETIPTWERTALHGDEAAYLDFRDLMCDTLTCPARSDSTIRYRDFSHISVAFARQLAPAVATRLSEAVALTPARAAMTPR